MPPLKTLVLALATTGFIGLTPLAAQAEPEAVAQQLTEARQEGSIWTAFALNRHLNPFPLKVQVEDGRAILTGRVETPVERELAEQIALGISGIDSVDNQLQIDPDLQPEESDSPTLAQRFDDATLTATVKSKLLWNTNTQGLDVAVKTEAGVVTLNGHARTPTAKELAGKLAANTDGVRRVNNYLSVSTADSKADEVRNAAKDAKAAISDGWITSKVKSSLFYSRNLDALEISVATQDGMVSLSGTVLSNAERELAIEIASNIRGVRGVDAGALRIVS